jgi:hypothetical protein
MAESNSSSRGSLSRASLLRGLALLAGFAIVVERAYQFYPFMADDAFISLRYARRLLDGRGLTWTDGAPVEGYSNLLWILGCALLGRLGLDLVVAARALGVLATLATMMVVAWAQKGRTRLAYIASISVLAFASPVAVWTMGGMEQPMVGLWLALGIYHCLPLVAEAVDESSSRRPALAGFFFGLLALSRPDGVLFGTTVAVVLLTVGLPRAGRLRTLLRFCLPLAGFFLAQLLFRLLYYGDFIPNTGRAKIAFTSAHALGGSYYVWTGMVALRAFFLLAIAGMVVCVRGNGKARVGLLAAPMAVWFGYIVLVGGDIFPAWRHFVPALVLAAFLIGDGIDAMMSLGPTGKWVVGFILVGTFLLNLNDQKVDKKLDSARSERWEWDGEVLGRFLSDAFSAQAPLLAVDAAGAVPYFSGLPSLDMLGLNDRYLAQHPPADFGQSFLFVGHELANGPYVLSRKPDLVLFGLPAGAAKPYFRSDKELARLDGFRDNYQLAAFEGGHPYRFRSLIWVCRESEKIGVQRTAGRVTVPGFLVGDTNTTLSHLDQGSRVVSDLLPRSKAALKGLALTAGRWTITADAEGENLLAVVATTGSAATAPRQFPLDINLAASSTIDIELSNQSGEIARLREIVIESNVRLGGATSSDHAR